MKITLSEHEIREALAEAIREKTSHIHTIDPAECYFDTVEIDGIEGSDHAIENITFSVNVD